MARLEANIPGRGIRIHQIANPEVGVWAGGDSISTSNASKGSVRHYAGGHRRAITWNAIDVLIESPLTKHCLLYTSPSPRDS